MADPVKLPEDQEQFKLNEVCKLANVQPYMLRFWGTEFPQLEAGKSTTGQRLYSREQVELILEIRRLLFDEGLTIAGARKKVAAMEERRGCTVPRAGGQARPRRRQARPTKMKRARPRARRGAERRKRRPEGRRSRPAAPGAPQKRKPRRQRLTRSPPPTYNHSSRRSRTSATRSTRSSRNSRASDL